MRRPVRFSWFTIAAALATALVIGAVVSGAGGAVMGPSGGFARLGATAAIGGPAAHHPHVVARYLGPTTPSADPTPDIACDAGSLPEAVQGQAPKADYDSGRAAKGYFCNARMVSHS